MSCYVIQSCVQNWMSSIPTLLFSPNFHAQDLLLFILPLDRLDKLVASLILANNFFPSTSKCELWIRRSELRIGTQNSLVSRILVVFTFLLRFWNWYSLLYLHLTLLLAWLGQWWRDLVYFIVKIAIVKRKLCTYFHLRQWRTFQGHLLVEVAFFPLIKMTHQTA